ncbi:hypothetical protein EW146_g6975 [Bondarzewia mesenterica]|uniref:DH domain-containing protein n=1 Tax=Bondarzewia mesenterica TaxID=1095465 RepID=A0A4S4LMT6_9AGAM|nr:hypothetical protein EW146_g6975 [Bondarzewia mesenterica]
MHSRLHFIAPKSRSKVQGSNIKTFSNTFHVHVCLPVVVCKTAIQSSCREPAGLLHKSSYDLILAQSKDAAAVAIHRWDKYEDGVATVHGMLETDSAGIEGMSEGAWERGVEKKSIVSSQIDIPIANNTLLNKAASQSTSLYQQCSSLRARLLRIVGFSEFFAISSPPDSSRQSTDPVTQLWDCFALGTPLCYLFNLLPPPVTPIAIETSPSSVDVDNGRNKKRAIALFAMQVKQVAHSEPFTVTDLWDRNSTDGFVKAPQVVNTVTSLVGHLPEDVFEEAPPLSPPSNLQSHESSDSLAPDTPSVPIPANAQEAARNNIVRELVETERKYVQDLEVMQKYSNALSQSNTIDQDTIHLLFPNLNKLLNFQRIFLIRLEGTAEMVWRDQRADFGFPIIASPIVPMHSIPLTTTRVPCSFWEQKEDEFAVYEPYCANYTNASELMLMEEQNLLKYNHLINVKSELPAFLIKPVQRICKYPLLLESLLKASSPADYPHYEELQAGLAAAKRITDKINEAQRRAENLQTVQNLATRVDDWKGHHVSQFGELLLDSIFMVTKSEVDREYHVFLFERIILCCKEDLHQNANGKKVGKSNSILKKPQTPTVASNPAAPGPSKKKTTPLLLKGRIYLNNVTDARAHVGAGTYSLSVYWKGDDDLEYFTLRCRNEEQVRHWETSVKRLIAQAAARRASDRSTSRLAYQSSNSTSPAPPRVPLSAYNQEPTYSSIPYSSTTPGPPSHPYGNASRSYRQSSPYTGEEQSFSNGSGATYVNGPPGYPPHDGFEMDDEYEDYPPAIVNTTSGRATPLDARRSNMTPSLDRDSVYDRPRAFTEDANGAVMSQWRNNSPMMPPPINGLPSGPSPRPSAARLNSSISPVSHASSDSTFAPAIRQSTGRPQLRSQFSSSRLRSTYENPESRSGAASPQLLPSGPLHRSRSASQPSAYVPKSVPPPLPSPWDRSKISTDTKRSSGSSHSTNDNSEDSPNGSSPITPFASSDSSLALSGRVPLYGKAIKVKVHFGSDIFVIQIDRSMEYEHLVEKVGKKIRLCGRKREDGPLRVKYEDEEGDLISMRSTEDVEMAFGGKASVILHVA